MIVAYQQKNRAVFLYGFAKNERENIDEDELIALRRLGSNWLNATPEMIAEALEDGQLQEVKDGD